jgi:predicted acylesterase/phospholipase RssA
MIKLLIAVAIVSADEEWPKHKKCRALAMSGGGSFGAYEAGVLYGLVKNAKDKSDFAWDVMSGVSAGSINSLAGGLWAPGTEDEMVDWLSMVW